MNEIQKTVARLVDGELTAKERAQFLSSLDEKDSKAWRNLALGLLERQMVTDALRKIEDAEYAEVVPSGIEKTKRFSAKALLSYAALMALGLGLGISVANFPQDESSSGISQLPDSNRPSVTQSSPLSKVAKQEADPELSESLPRGGYISANLRDGSQLIVPVSYVQP